MCGGDPEVFKNDLQEMLESIATTNGCLYTGKTGSGHYLKMIHNAMLYGYMQTLGEGFELLEKVNLITIWNMLQIHLVNQVLLEDGC